MPSNSSETIVSPSLHNNPSAPEWGALTHYTTHIIWSVHPPETQSEAITLTGVYVWVYGCTRGVTHPVYDERDYWEASYTPTTKNMDRSVSAIWSY